MPEGRFLVRPCDDRLVRRTAGAVVLTLVAGLLAVTGVTPVASARAAVSLAQVGAWSLDAGTGATAADSAGSHPLTLGSGATWTPGIRGASALALNGTGTGNATSSGAVLNTGSSFSVSAYVKLNNLNGFQTFVSQDGTTNSGFYLQLQDSDRFSFNMEGQDATGSSSVSAPSNANAVVGYWYHLVGVYNSVAGTTALYVNGRLQSTMSKPAAFATTGNLVVGRAKYSGSPVDFVNGTVDDVRVYSGALTADDVEQISDAAYWKLDEGSGTSAADEGLNATTATLTNGPTWGTGVKPPYAVQLDGTNDLVDAGKTVIDTSKSFTVAAWARTTNTSTAGVVASVDGSNRSAFTLQIGADGRWAFTRPASDTAGAASTSVASTGTAATSWHHLVAVYDSVAQTMTLYANGTLQASASYTTGWAGTGSFVLGRGKSGGAAASYFTGSVDEVHVYPFVVDAAMVTALSAKPVPPVPATPTATTPSSTSVTLGWTAPAQVTGAGTTGYTVTPYVNGTAGTPQTFNTTATTQTLTGLTPGSSYRYTVAAINSTGTSGPSAQSAAVTPNAVPGTPTAPTATAGTQAATVTWSAPSNSGTAITGYRVTPYIGATAQAGQTFASTATTQTVTGLTAGSAYTFTVAATNAAGTGTPSAASNPVTPNGAPTVSSGTPPGGVVGTAYSFSFTASGGTAPATWSVSAGSLPAGLALSSAGVLSGTPTTSGSWTSTVRAVDASGASATQSVTVVVSARPGTVAAPTATAGLTSAVLTWTAPAANGSTITGYVITPYLSGTAQPTITVDPSAKTRTVNGLTAGSMYTFAVAAVNANGTGTASAASNPVTPYAALNAPTIGTVTAGTTSATVSWTAPTSTGGSPVAGYVVTPYIGGTAQTPQTFTGTATTRTLTGLTPGTAYTFKVAAQNSSGTTVVDRLGAEPVTAGDGGPDWVDNAAFRSGSSSVYHPGAAIGAFDASVPSTTPTALFAAERWGSDAGDELRYAVPVPAGVPLKVRLYFANTCACTTGVGARSFDVALDAVTVLPAFDPVAAAGGTSIATMREFAVTSDGMVNIDFTHRSDNPAIYGIEILQTGTATTGPASSASAAVTPNDSPALTSAAPPSGEVGVAYSHQLVVNGGSAPFTWAVSGGSLPAGLTLGPASGVLSGTPTSAGSSTFTVQVTDASGATATRNVTLVVAAQPSVAFGPAAGEVGVAYSEQPTLTGGTGPFTWSVSAGSLPGGVGINASTGLVSGTPTASGTFSVTVRVVDAFNQVATRTASIVIAPLPTLTSTPPKQYQQAGFSFTFAATGGTGPFTYAVVRGSLPPGISLSSAGVLSGQTNQGSYPFTVRATDAKGQTTDDPVTLVVDAAPVQLVKTASAASVAPGGTVTFTLTATNISGTSYGNTHFYDPLADVTDDATYNDDATVTAGSLAVTSSQLEWAIGLNPGQSATLTYTVTVADPDTGNKLLTGEVSGSFASTSCSAGQRTSACTAAVTVSGLSVTTTASTSSTTPGSTVTYTVVVANTGRTAYPSTSVTQNLSGLLDDATYRGDAAAGSGRLTYTSPTLTWTGALGVGASVTISYTVLVNDPDTGDRVLAVTAVSAAAGSTCPNGSAAASCSAGVTVLVPALSVTTSALTTSTTPGDPVTFRMTLADHGQTAYTGASAVLDLAGVLDDATYVSATAASGTVGYASGTVTWTGDLAVGATVVVTVVVQVGDPDPGDRSLVVVASSAAAGSSCPSGSMTAACSTTVPVLVPGLTVTTSADVTSTTPGSVVTYTVLVTNSGQTAATGAAVSVPLTGVLDDATYNGDVTGAGTSYAGSTLSWTGDLAVGASATLTYSVTVRDPDPGDRSLTSTAVSPSRGSTCPAGGADSRCTTTVAVLVPALSVVNTVDAGSTTTPGTLVRYTTRVVNTGQTSYAGAVVLIDIQGVVDDATYQNDRTASTGTITSQPDDTIRWVLNLGPGQAATVTASFRVNNPVTGNKTLTTNATSSAAGSTCPTAATSTSCRTSVAILVPGLTTTTTSSATAVTPGDPVDFTVTVANTGETTATSATVTDDLTAVLSDATYTGAGAPSSGSLSYSAPLLTWTGTLGPGASATFTFTVTVRDPDPGNKQVVNRITSGAPGSNCPVGSTDSRCVATVNVNVPGLTVVAAAGVASTAPGAMVTSTVTVTNTGGTAYPAASVSLPLAGVLDDADLSGQVSATSGTAAVTGSTLGWSGSLAVGASATITYAVQVHAADSGDNRLTGTVVSTSRGSSCPSGGTDPRCTTTIPVARLVIDQDEPVAYATPGSVLFLSVTFTNTGQVPYTGISVLTPGADTLDDVISAGDQHATSGSLSVTPELLSWTGSIPVGGSVTVSAHVTVKDPPTGNRVIDVTWYTSAAGSNCPQGSGDPRCSDQVPVLVPGLTLTKTADTTATTPGAPVTYTVTATNSGETPYSGATFSDDLTGVLDDATFDGSTSPSTGTVTYSGGVLTWSGDLAAGASATVSYTVVVKDPDPGDKAMVNAVSSSAVGSTCPPASGSSACRSTVVVLTPGLTVIQTADLDNATLGSRVTFTVTVRNSGQTSYPAAAFSSDLAAVLDDATYDPTSLTADRGTPGYSDGVVSWSGALAPGAVATIGYAVTVRNPDPGDQAVAVTALSSTAGSNCAATSTDGRCTARVAVVDTVSLTFAAAASVRTTAAGRVVSYTVTATNSTDLPLLDVQLTESLAGILDDSAYNTDVHADRGTATVVAGQLSWLGSLPAGATATITFSVTVDAVPTGDSVLTGTVASESVPGSNNCTVAGSDPRCTTTVPVAALLITQSYAETSTTPGSPIHLSATFTNTGKAPYEGISISSASDDTLDDAIPTGDQTATSGSLVLSATAITWSGDIPVGGSVTVTGTLTVKRPDPGDKVITGTLVTTAPGSNCPAGGADARCTALTTVRVPRLTLTTTSDAPVAVPGGPAAHVVYTVSIANTGQTPYVGARVSDSLVGVLDDAGFDPGEVTASSGSVAYSASVLTWTGDLAVDQTVTVTIPVTAGGAAGDQVMVNAVSSAEVGSSCPPGNGSPACRTTVVVLNPALTFTTTTSAPSAEPGDVVVSTVTVRNTGQTAYDGATFGVDLSGVLDDATYGGDAASTPVGAVQVTAGQLTWTGSLAPGETATVTYGVTVLSPDTGNFRLDQTVRSSELGSTCADASEDPRCSTSVPVAGLHLSDVTDVSSAGPGGVVRFTETYTNSGQVPLYGVHVTIDGHDVFDDASYNGDAHASSGSLGDPGGTGALVWTGDLPVGATVTTTGSVTVDNPLRPDGNRHLRTRISTDEVPSNCPTDSTDPACLIDVLVLTPGLSIVTTPGSGTTTPGSQVGYTTTVTNTGATDYAATTVTDDLSAVLDDTAAPTDVHASSGEVVVSGATLTWTGDLAVGASVTFGYTVEVDDPDPGDLNLVDHLSSDAIGSTCPTGGTGSGCSSLVTVLIPALDVGVTADTAAAYPGAVVTYTLTVTNSGQTDYLGAGATVGLAGVLDDATFGEDAQPSLGSVDYAAPDLTWTGDLAAGESAVVTYTVTVHDPDPGNRSLLTTVSSAAAGSSCPTASPCSSSVVVQIPALSVSTSADATEVTPGQRVTFTITLHNTGQRPYLGTVTTASLAGLLDDASLRGGFRASSGTVSYEAGTLTWTGTLLVAGTATISYTVLVDDPDSGDRSLTTSVQNQSSGSTCRDGSTSSLCSADVAVLVPALDVQLAADATTTTPGSSSSFTLLVHNSGQTPYAGAVVTTSLASVLDDADYGADAHVVAGGGEVRYADGLLTWTGDLGLGASTLVRFSVTVDDPDTGDRELLARSASTERGSSCPTAAAAGCSATVQVLVPALEVAVAASQEAVPAGEEAHFSVTVSDSGETDYADAGVGISLAGLLDDATLDVAQLAPSAGTVELDGQTLVWHVPVLRGESQSLLLPVTTSFPATGDKSLHATVLSPVAGSTCPSGSSGDGCTAQIAVQVPQLNVAKTASATHVVAGQRLDYTVVATNTGESPYRDARLTDDLTGVLQHAQLEGDVTATRGDAGVTSGVLGWHGPLAVGESVVLSYAVTVDPDPVPSAFVVTNQVSAPSTGSTCPVGGNASACSTSTTVDADTLTLSGLTDAFSLTGLPGDTVSLDDAVVGTVVTNNVTGYRVTVQAAEDALVGPGSSDTIPVERLQVRANGRTTWIPLSSTTPVTVGGRDTASAPGGDAISNDARIQIPDASSGTYSGELDYVVATQ